MASEPVWSREVWGEGMVRGCFGCGSEGGGILESGHLVIGRMLW